MGSEVPDDDVPDDDVPDDDVPDDDVPDDDVPDVDVPDVDVVGEEVDVEEVDVEEVEAATAGADAIVKAFQVQARAPVEPMPSPIVALRVALLVVATDTDVAPAMAVKDTAGAVPVKTTPETILMGPKAKVTGTVEGEAPVTARVVAKVPVTVFPGKRLTRSGSIGRFSVRPLTENDLPVTTGLGAIDPAAVIPVHEVPTGEAQFKPKSDVLRGWGVAADLDVLHGEEAVAFTGADAIVKALWVQARAPVEPTPPPIVALRVALVVVATDTERAPLLGVRGTGPVVPLMTAPAAMVVGPKVNVTGTVEGEAPVTAREVAKVPETVFPGKLLTSDGDITILSERPLVENDLPATTGLGAIDPFAVVAGNEPMGEAQFKPKPVVSAPAVPLVPIAPSAVTPAKAVAAVASATAVRIDFLRLLAISGPPSAPDERTYSGLRSKLRATACSD